MSLYSLLWFFMIYAVAGWIIEVAFHAVTLGKVVNRGFLNGPLCPVYGVGVILVLLVMQALGDSNIETSNPLILFGAGIVLATGAELAAGFLLDKLFHARWWDYSDRKFNLNGYICLSFSIIWGLAIAFVLRVIQPLFERFVAFIPFNAGCIILIVTYAVFVLDIVLTTLEVLKFNKELEQMAQLKEAILKVSDGMSEKIAGSTLKTMERIDVEKAKAEERRAELEERLRKLRSDLTSHKIFGKGRIIKAFPSMKHKSYDDIIRWLKQRT